MFELNGSQCMIHSKKEHKDYYVRQCTLEKGNKTQVLWIPDKFAVKGRILKLKEDNGWVVKVVSALSLPYKYLSERSQDYKNTRKASDI